MVRQVVGGRFVFALVHVSATCQAHLRTSKPIRDLRVRTAGRRSLGEAPRERRAATGRRSEVVHQSFAGGRPVVGKTRTEGNLGRTAASRGGDYTGRRGDGVFEEVP